MLDTESFAKCGSLIECDDGFLIGIGRREWLNEPTPLKPVFFFPSFFLKSTTPFCSHHITFFLEKKPFNDFLNSLEIQEEEPLPWSCPDRESYVIQFTRLRKLIETGELQKGVPYSRRAALGSINGRRILAMLKNAARKRGRGLLYGFWSENEGMLGVTPEKLFVMRGPTVHVDAVAGTATSPDFKEKESVEHMLVIDGIQQALGAYGEVAIGKTNPIPYGQLFHLFTPVEMKIREEVSFKELVEKLHPTPALGTYPKKQGAAWLEGADHLTPRRRYGAPAGCIIPERKEARCLVAIRNIQWDAKGIEMFAGGGVTDKSELEKEWNEIQNKFRSIELMLSV